MGKKGGKDKKKGKGAEKTLAKTEKKLSNKLKKELKSKGEDDIETILAKIESEEKKRLQVTESIIEQPSRRLNFSFVSHPEKEQLIMYGGEFYDGQKTLVYGDLFFYNIPNRTWSVVKAPGGPAPRCGHQMVTTNTNKGQLWVFGGEFASPSQSQFYHYRDLWVFHLGTKQWEKITSPNGPSARSGHRMVVNKKKLFVFGGFHDNLRDYKYFNDLYAFNMESYKWEKIEATGNGPAPRSACCMAALNDGRILIYGGYSKEKIKKDVDKGHVFTDAFLLTPNKNDTTGLQFKWVQIKLGNNFSPRCSMPMTVSGNNSFAYCFGGVFDIEDEEENISGNFFNDLYQLDLEKFVWKTVTVSGKKDKEQKARRRKKDTREEEGGDDQDEEMKEVEEIEKSVESTIISDDGIFKVTVGPVLNNQSVGSSSSVCDTESVFSPSPRINCGLAIKHGVLYLYGGMAEDGDKQFTFNDFYSLDLKKMDEWNTIKDDPTSNSAWVGSDSESGEESDENENENENENDDDEDEEGEDEDEDEESGMDTD